MTDFKLTHYRFALWLVFSQRGRFQPRPRPGSASARAIFSGLLFGQPDNNPVELQIADFVAADLRHFANALAHREQKLVA